MKNNLKFYSTMFFVSLIIFILEVFIVQIDGVIGLIICILSTYFLVGATIRLIRLSKIFNESLMSAIDILFFF